MPSSAGYTAFKIPFELSPIILTGGITKTFPGFALPIMAMTEAANFPFGLLSGQSPVNLDDWFAHYQVLPGSTLINQDIAKFPFANATVAANAVIQQPIQVSMLMICPIRNKLGWAEKLGIISGLKWAFDRHNLLGGTYTILTPSYIYMDCIMKGFHDVSSQLTKQVQNTYQLDFEKPLLYVDDAKAILNTISDAIEGAYKEVADVFGIPASQTQTAALLPTLMPGTATQTATTVIGGGATGSTPAFGGQRLT